MARKSTQKAAHAVENIASVRESDLVEVVSAQAEVISETDGGPIFHADEEAGDGNE